MTVAGRQPFIGPSNPDGVPGRRLAHLLLTAASPPHGFPPTALVVAIPPPRKASIMRARSIKTLLSVAVAGALSAAALTGCSSTDSASSGWAKAPPETLVFAAVPPTRPARMPTGSRCRTTSPRPPVTRSSTTPTSDYTALVAALVAGKADVGVMGGLQYVMATNKGAEIEPVAAGLTSPDAEDAGYFSEAIVAADSPIASLADAKGKSVCFVDPNSTSGFLFGLNALSKAGLDVTSTGQDANGRPTFDDFTPFFAGSHDKSAQAVASKQCDLGFAEDTVAAEGVKKGQVKVINREYVRRPVHRLLRTAGRREDQGHRRVARGHGGSHHRVGGSR